MAPIRMAPPGPTQPQAGVMATRPATRPEAAPSRLGWPRNDPLAEHPGQRRSGSRDGGVEDDERGQAVGLEVGAGVEAVPAEEEEAGTGQHEGQVVRRHLVLAVADALAQNDGADEAGDAGIDVHNGAAGEVDGAQLEEIAIGGVHQFGIGAQHGGLGLVGGGRGEIGQELGGRFLADHGLDDVEVVRPTACRRPGRPRTTPCGPWAGRRR